MRLISQSAPWRAGCSDHCVTPDRLSRRAGDLHLGQLHQRRGQALLDLRLRGDHVLRLRREGKDHLTMAMAWKLHRGLEFLPNR